MQYIKLGNTDVTVSIFPIGGMKFGTALNRETVFSLLDTYKEQGGNFIDTANMYAFWLSDDPNDNGGESETVIGEWLRSRGDRDSMVITSKVGNVTNRRMLEEGPCLKTDYMIQECERSLQRLGIEQIDLYYAHTDDRTTPVEEVMTTFDKLQRQGKIKHIGASNWRSWRLEQARNFCRENNTAFFCCTQQKHSYFQTFYGTQGLWDHPYSNHDFQDYCKTFNLTMFGWEPLLAGMYLPGKELGTCKYDYRTPNNRRRFTVLEEIAKETGATYMQIVLAWMFQSDPPIFPVVAADTDDQLIEDMNAADLILDKSHMKRLNEAPLVAE